MKTSMFFEGFRETRPSTKLIAASVVSLGMLIAVTTPDGTSPTVEASLIGVAGKTSPSATPPTPTPTETWVKPGAGNHPPNMTPLPPRKLKKILGTVGFRGEAKHVAWAIVMRESRGIPGIIGAVNPNGTRDHGLFQINDIHRVNTDFSRILAAKYNARYAYTISAGGTDFGAWGVGTTGWAGHLKKTAPVTWQKLQDALQPWLDAYPRRGVSLPKTVQVSD